MSVISASEARANFPDIMNRAEYSRERILIQRHGKPAVAIISIEDLKLLEAIEDAIDSAKLRRAIEENTGFITIEEIIAKRPNE
ncbi:type II toxin-antitoxin system Phd/YefM family antitoxin [Cronbergia sp. UHCC 0137]|uniref:type II toxin-antitoxin system Phd/YefM family antitoxin n=1 Tax=Cronbergia sp. UHCC 0137 TaxID=3110239 RepID=UPI002B21DC01|nr:type II toxin-antitoxin system Phd/YefM family antitoxin [Cronbergia sp. UHCC 0137]MEA5617488.1 type II toxin-antitoxin system Phd/YefM family antitoxin [Cronbergia sp. UHCC 0137]